MKRQIYHFMQLSVLFVLVAASSVAAYEDTITHPALTKRAVENTQLDPYLKNQLGLLDGLVTIFPSYSSTKNIRDLLQQGSIAEDHPLCRATNHFHNPLKSWDRAGIGTISYPLCPSWDVTSYSTRHSALTWATGYETYSGPTVSRNNQQMGWDNARAYFYSALTSPTSTARETNFAKTFQSMGQVLHLLQDMAVPAHVRNDFWYSHVWTGGANPYELYVRDHNDLIASLTKEQIAAVMPAFTSPRQTDYWDTSDGSVIVPVQILDPSFQSKAGMAEYTNANFVSEGTLFSNSTEFEYPKKSSTVEAIYNIPDPFSPGATVKRPYYYKTQDWEVGYHLAGVNYTYFYDPNAGSLSPDKIIPPLDDYVHADYAQRLLPRAVGYSAGLLNYFFRGQIDMISDPTNSANYVIKNLSNEDMTGDFSLYYDDTNDNRYLISTWNLSVNANSQSDPVTFTAPTSPAPKENGKYMLVFKGIQGNENDAVAGEAVSLKKKRSALRDQF